MNLKQFVKNHKENWQQLEQMMHQLHGRKKRITGHDIHLFYRLYQKAAQNLSYAQTYFPNEDVTLFLNELVAKSHNILYKDQVSSGRQMKQFFTRTFIRLVTEQNKAIVVAMGLF